MKRYVLIARVAARLSERHAMPISHAYRFITFAEYTRGRYPVPAALSLVKSKGGQTISEFVQREDVIEFMRERKEANERLVAMILGDTWLADRNPRGDALDNAALEFEIEMARERECSSSQ